ncbi:Geraniol 8-hydroxylase [Vitis vinifera]|uniref:Geraniol 8-hydroxylase n=1 Tax=Vitis vinifera TaxID=29760 RepID=A0A438IX06_VITVI|nr:Geraniol 8-hydroxylase [Vitis vinifera]
MHSSPQTQSDWPETWCSQPPSRPRPLPIIGNILKLGDKPHRSLANLSKTYGPVMSLKLGSIATIVISSSETAKEVLHRNDQAFSSRTVRMLSEPIIIMNLQWYGFQHQRIGERLGRYAPGKYFRRGCAVDINGAVFTASLNLLSNTIFSINLAHHGSNFSQEFKNIAWGVMEGIGRPNFVDYFPAFRLIDPQASKDVLDALLNLTKENDNEWSCSDIKHLLLDLFVAGTDTTSSTVEWAMAELLCNPEKMAKAQKEIRGVLGNEGIVQESDISKFPYLQSIVKETFRLHPPAPLLVPHKAETDVEICGFTIPKNSQVLVNAWAIGRDPSTWPNPNAFMPERRICPGMPLAHRMVHLMLASLLYSHAWKLEDCMKPENMDMSEKFGLTLQKAQPLRAIPIKV